MGTSHLRLASGEKVGRPSLLISLCFRKPSWFRHPNHHQRSGLWVWSTGLTKLEGAISMILGAWCGQLGVGGWILMGLFWATFVGLVLWALSRLFAPVRENDAVHQDADDVDERWAREQMNRSNYQAPREKLTAPAPQRGKRTR